MTLLMKVSSFVFHAVVGVGGVFVCAGVRLRLGVLLVSVIVNI